jgi:hypothetical protein
MAAVTCCKQRRTLVAYEFTNAMRIVPADQRQPGAKTPEEIAKMSQAERWDYCRQFDQSKMPANPYDKRKDPRGA